MSYKKRIPIRKIFDESKMSRIDLPIFLRNYTEAGHRVFSGTGKEVININRYSDSKKLLIDRRKAIEEIRKARGQKLSQENLPARERWIFGNIHESFELPNNEEVASQKLDEYMEFHIYEDEYKRYQKVTGANKDEEVKNKSHNDIIYGRREIGALFDIHPKTVDKWRREDPLMPVYEVGGKRKVFAYKSELTEWRTRKKKKKKK